MQQITAVAFSKNGQTFVSCSNDLIAVWTLNKDSALLKYKIEQTDNSDQVCVSDNGAEVAVHKGGLTLHMFTNQGTNKDIRNL